MTVNRPTEAQTLRAAERILTDALPPRWSFRSARQPAARARADATWTLKAPDGQSVAFAVEVKRSLLGPELDAALAKVTAFNGLPFIAAPYLGPTLRTTLAARGVSYADSTGNLRVVADAPGLFVERTGAAKDPWPSDETLRSLRGRGAGRAVRALVDFAPPFGVRELAERADVPLGSLSRTLDLLARAGLLTREPRGPVTALDWERTIRRWSEDYDVVRSNTVASFLDPRGLDAVVSKLADVKWPYAATGGFAAQRFAPIAPARQAAIYVEDIGPTAERLRLRPADVGANVLLVEPYDPVVFDRATRRKGLRVVAPSQLAVDLLTGPGRDPSEGNELLAWMGKNQDAWRA